MSLQSHYLLKISIFRCTLNCLLRRVHFSMFTMVANIRLRKFITKKNLTYFVKEGRFNRIDESVIGEDLKYQDDHKG